MMKPPSRCRDGLFALGLSTCLLTSACTTAINPAGASLEESVPGSRSGMMALAAPDGTSSSSSSMSLSAAPSGPLATLPEAAGGISKTRSKSYVNGLRQDISLTGSVGRTIQNGITVVARTSKQKTLDETVPLYKPTESSIRSEIGAQFPKMSMQVSDREFSNSYGPYGLALGRGSGEVHCLYMWQWIDENRIPASAGVIGPVSVRVRVCQDKMNFDTMRSLVDNLTIGAGTGGTETTASTGGAQILPLPADGSEPSEPRKARRIGHRRRQVRKAESASAAVAPARQTVLVAPMASQGTIAIPSRPSVDLPPQAYLGPKGAAAPQSPNAAKPH